MLLHMHLTRGYTCMFPRFWSQDPKVVLTTVKTTLCTKFGAKNVNISCLFSHVWQKCNSKITCDVIVHHSITMHIHTCMTRSRKLSLKALCSMCMRTTCPKWVRSGQSENEFSVVLQQKCTRNCKLKTWRFCRITHECGNTIAWAFTSTHDMIMLRFELYTYMCRSLRTYSEKKFTS